MSYTRDKVSPIVVRPPPGTYAGPLRLSMHTDTPGAQILFTLDGSMPIPNSDREHGYRCEHYNRFLGYTLRSGGKFVVTVQAFKDGMVPTRVDSFEYHITGLSVKMQTTLPDRIIERRFHAMERLDPPTSVQLAKKRGGGDIGCYLVDTCPKAKLQQKLAKGEKVQLFRIRYDERSAIGRNYLYTQVVAPNMNISLPKLPEGKGTLTRPAPGVDLTNYGTRSVSPSMYRPPSTFLPTRSHSSMSTHKALPINAISSQRAVSVFEHRAGVDQCTANTVDYYDDKDEVAEMTAYQKHNEDVYNDEQGRRKMGRVEKIPVAEEGGADRDVLGVVSLADGLCTDANFLRFVQLVSFSELAVRLSGGSLSEAIGVLDVMPLVEGKATQRELVAMLKLLEEPNFQSPHYSRWRLLAVTRYVFNVFHNIPEAVFGLVIATWNGETASSGAEVSIGRVAWQCIVRRYHQTEGADPATVQVLEAHMFASAVAGAPGIVWAQDGPASTTSQKARYNARASSASVTIFLQDMCPVVDAALLRMDDVGNPMYSTPLRTP
jgi:hypothetical protein